MSFAATVLDMPHRPDGIVGRFGRLHGGVPADHEVIPLLRGYVACEVSNPVTFDQIALKRDRALLELGAEYQRRHCVTLPLKRGKRFTDGIQHIAGATDMGSTIVQLDGLLPLRDRRKTEVLEPSFFQ